MTSYRDQLLAAAEHAAFPAEKTLDPATGSFAWSADDAAVIRRVLDLFGISALDCEDEDADRVINTVCTLSIEVAAHLRTVDEAGGCGGGRAGARHAAYTAYLAALSRGDREAIAAGARRMRIDGGIPNGSPPLEEGPLPQD